MNLDRLEAEARTLLRLFGPRASAAQDEQFAIRHCRRCTPDPPTYRCPVCAWETPNKYQIALHYRCDPGYCRNAGNQLARAWAKKV